MAVMWRQRGFHGFKRLQQQAIIGRIPVGVFTDEPAPPPGAGQTMEKPEHMPADILDRNTAPDLSPGIFTHKQHRAFPISNSRGTVQFAMALSEKPGILVSRPAKHHAIEFLQMLLDSRDRRHPAIEHDLQIRPLGFESISPVITQFR